MLRTLAGLVVAVAFTAAVSAQDKPADVVQKAVQAHGGEAALKKHPAGTSKLAGKIITPGGDLPFTGELAYTLPNKVRTAMTVTAGGQKTELVQVVNGDKAKQTQNGKAEELSPTVRAELKESAVIHELSLLYPLLDANRFTLTAEKDAALDGRDCAVVLVQGKGLKDVRLYFDRKTGLLAGMRRQGLDTDQKPVDELTVFGDYKAVEGVQLPMLSKVSHAGRPFLEIKVTEFKPADKLDDKLFAVE